MTGILNLQQNRYLKIGVIILVIFLLVYMVMNYTNLLNNRNVNSFQDVSDTVIEFDTLDDIISVVDTELIEFKLKYKNIHTNPENIFFDLTRVDHNDNDNDIKFYPSKRNNNYSKLSIVHQDSVPLTSVSNVVLKDVPNMSGIVDSEIVIHDDNGDLKVLDNGTNLIQKGDIITFRLKLLDSFQGALFDYKNLNKFFMVINFSLNNNSNTYEQSILEMKPIELIFKKNIYYSLGLILTDNNDSIIKKYVSRISQNKPLTVYSNDIGKNELHSIELVKSNNSGQVMWDNQINNQGYLLRSLNDDNKRYYRINQNGEMVLTFSDIPFDLLNFERTQSGLYNISTVNGNLYANQDFKFIIQKDEYGRFKNMKTNKFVEAGEFDVKENKNDLQKIMTLGDYIDSAISTSSPSDDSGIINYSYIQRGFTLDEIKIEHNNGAVLSNDNTKHLPHIANHSNKIVTVQFSNLTKDDEYDNKFIMDTKNNQSISEFYVYIKHDGNTTIDLNDINIKYNSPSNTPLIMEGFQSTPPATTTTPATTAEEPEIATTVTGAVIATPTGTVPTTTASMVSTTTSEPTTTTIPESTTPTIQYTGNTANIYGRILPLKDRAHFLPRVDPISGYNQTRFILYGIGATDGTITRYHLENNKYKPELHEGQKIIDDNDKRVRYVHVVREHIPTSVRTLQIERMLISIPVNLVKFEEDGKYTLSKTIHVKVMNDKLTAEQSIEYYHVIMDVGTILQQLNNCNNSVILNNLHKLRLTAETDVYNIIDINHPDYKSIKFGKCDKLLNRDNDISNMRSANNFSKGILDNLIRKSGDILSKRSFELSNIQTTESSLLEQSDIKDYYNYENNSLIDTNPYSKMDELTNYYDLKGREGFQDQNINYTSLENYLGIYHIYPGQFILLDELDIQIDKNYIGFIEKGVPIMKFEHDSILPIFSPFQIFQGVKFRLISYDKMVHNISTTNLEKLFMNTGLKSPNFIYLSKHDTVMKHGDVKSIYKLSNREYTTLFQMKKLK
jgi:hypothetical protein